jgi:hypothetical protein
VSETDKAPTAAREIERVYCKEPAYVGTEPYASMPIVADFGSERRGWWRFAEDAVGIVVTYDHPTNGGTARIPWVNIKSVSYKRKGAK